MVSEKLPKTWFEKMAYLVTNRIPKFFSKQFEPEKDFKDFRELRMKTTPVPKTVVGKKQYVHDLETEQKVLEFLLHNGNAETKIVEEQVPNTKKLQGQQALNACYVTNNLFGNPSTEYEAQHKKVITAMLQILHQFQYSGKKIFRMEEGITSELLLTDCAKVDDDYLQLPFDTVCLHIPYNTSLKVRGCLIEYVFITQTDTGSRSDFDLFCVLKDGAFYNEKFYFQGGDIKTQVTKQITDKFGGSKQAKEENIKLMSFVLSVILYLNSEEVDQTSITPYRSKIFDEYTTLPVCSLGRNIVINKHFSGVFKDGESSERVIHVLKWTVRGHFRHQKMGFQRLQEKVIWIRPFLKGRERLDEALTAKPTVYTVK